MSRLDPQSINQRGQCRRRLAAVWMIKVVVAGRGRIPLCQDPAQPTLGNMVGNLVFVETLRQRPSAKAEPRLSDLALGQTIAVVDLSEPDRPRVVQRLEGFKQPFSVSINAKGSLVAVSFGLLGAGKKTPLAIYKFKDGKLSAPLIPKIPGWNAGDGLISFPPNPGNDGG